MPYYKTRRLSALVVVPIAFLFNCASSSAQVGQSEWITPSQPGSGWVPTGAAGGSTAGLGSSDWVQPGGSGGSSTAGLGSSGWVQPGGSGGASTAGLGSSGWVQPGGSGGASTAGLGSSGWVQPGGSGGSSTAGLGSSGGVQPGGSGGSSTVGLGSSGWVQPGGSGGSSTAGLGSSGWVQPGGSGGSSTVGLGSSGWVQPGGSGGSSTAGLGSSGWVQPGAAGLAPPQSPPTGWTQSVPGAPATAYPSAPHQPGANQAQYQHPATSTQTALPTNQPDWVPPNPSPVQSAPSQAAFPGQNAGQGFENAFSASGSMSQSLGDDSTMLGGGVTRNAYMQGGQDPASMQGMGGMGSMSGMGGMGELGALGALSGLMGGGMGVSGGGASANPMDAIGKAIGAAAQMGLIPGGPQGQAPMLQGSGGAVAPGAGGHVIYTQPKKQGGGVNNVPGVQFGKTVSKTVGNSVNRQVPRVINAATQRGIRRALYGW